MIDYNPKTSILNNVSYDIPHAVAAVCFILGKLTPIDDYVLYTCQNGDIAYEHIKKCSYRWNFWQSCTEVIFYYDDGSERGRCFYKWRVFDRKATFYVGLDPEAHQMINEALHKMLPGIKQVNGLNLCECAFHNLHTNTNFPSMCDQLGGKWVCDECQNFIEQSLKLPASTKTELARNPDERAKLTKSLRFTILERDGFRCKACGANPRDDKSVVLHIDHIMPVSKGGKTTEDNLQVLCGDCNLAKSDKIVNQMSLWSD